MKFSNLKQGTTFSLLLFIVLMVGFPTLTYSQEDISENSFNLTDLSKLKSSQISDAQLKAYIAKGKAEGYSAEQVMTIAQQRGLSPSEAATFLQRIRILENELEEEPSIYRRSQRSSPDLEDLISPDIPLDSEEEKGSLIFGSQLFSNNMLSFEPSMNIPTPVNYVLGVGDEIIVDIWGASTNLYMLEVGPEGTVIIDNVGPLYVNGLTIEEGEKKIVAKLKQLYRGLRPGEAGQDTYARVSLGRVRTIQVTVLGEVKKPGNYSVSSLTTVFNALYRAGGINEVGSFRKVEVIRNNKIATTLDIYDFLVKGDQKKNIRLNDQDIIKVGVYESRVETRGEVKRPAFYELSEGEKFSDLIEFTGGFTDSAYTQQVMIYRNTLKERRIERVHSNDFDTYTLKNGDVVHIEPLLNRFENRVVIDGSVWRPGEYELTHELTLLQLIEKADGLRPEAFLARGVILRVDKQHNFYTESFNLEKVMANPELYDVKLQYDDQIIIKSIFEMREDRTVTLSGAVLNGGTFVFRDSMTLGDLILEGNGFSSSASEARIEVFRRIVGEAAPTKRSTTMSDAFMFNVTRNLELEGDAKSFILHPFDQVYVRYRPDYQSQRSVRIEGEVMYPGTYVLRSRHERISDLIARAGGITDEAFTPGATLIRSIKNLDRAEVKIGETVNQVIELDESENNSIGINLDVIIKKPGSVNDMFLREGDVVKVPVKLQTVSVDGAVLRSSEIRYIPNRGINYYISNSGGYAENARKRKVYVVHANGDVQTRKNFLFFRSTPKITPGAEIIIPAKVEQEKLSSVERISIMSSIVSTAAIVVTALSRF